MRKFWNLKHMSDNTNELAMNFWGRVDNAQKHMGLSLQELCSRAKVNYGTVMNKRSLAKLPNLEAAYSISHVLGKSLDWLLTGLENDTGKGFVSMDDSLIPYFRSLSEANARQRDAVALLLGME